MIETLKLKIAKLRHEQYGASSERSTRLLEQLELALADLEETAAEQATAVETAPAGRGCTGAQLRAAQAGAPAIA